MDPRRAREDESTEIADLWLRSRRASVPAIPAPVHSDEEVRTWFREVVVPDREVWVTEIAGVIVGMLVLEDDWVDRLVRAGGLRVAARNPYRERWGVTVADPDGFRLVLSVRSWR